MTKKEHILYNQCVDQFVIFSDNFIKFYGKGWYAINWNSKKKKLIR